MAMITNLKKYFTIENIHELARYLKGFIPNIQDDETLLSFLDAIYTHGPDEDF